MKFDHAVKIGGIYYPAGTEIPETLENSEDTKISESTLKKQKGKEQKDDL